MRMTRFAFALFALSAAGCAVDAADPDLAVDAPPLSESWTVSTSASTTSWSSGIIANLSGAYLHCNLDHGEEFFLTDIGVNEEPLANPANFIARMEARCREFDLLNSALPRTGTFVNAVVFAASSYSPGVNWTQVPAVDSYPIGVQLRVNLGSHVKDVRFIYAHKDATGMALDVAAPSYSPWAIGYAGPIQTLSCPPQEVVTGMDLQYDNGSGQIRRLDIHCRELNW
ncbi:hypothetical protein BE08_41240 [Sorangium cellulosum]|uniref:Secreted protein n=1 Tax=Sorangium cellulosum TaxID=56 RepID=A0A150PPZ0_SORCE|nr:hypothetical protein BE08_41240 [Sorangium cellulosum]